MYTFVYVRIMASFLSSLPKPIHDNIVYDFADFHKCHFCNELYPRTRDTSTNWRERHNKHYDECPAYKQFKENSAKLRTNRIANNICKVCNESGAHAKCPWCHEWYHSFKCYGTDYTGVCKDCNDDVSGD